MYDVYKNCANWFFGSSNSKCKNALHGTKRIFQMIDKLVEYLIEPPVRGNLDVAAINFMLLGFGMYKYLEPDPEVHTSGTQVAMMLIALLTLTRLIDKLTEDVLQQSSKQKDQQNPYWNFCRKWSGKIASATQFTTKTLFQSLYDFTTIMVVGLFFEPAFEWFGLSEEYKPVAESVTLGVAILMFIRSAFKNGYANWSTFNKKSQCFDIKKHNFTSAQIDDLKNVFVNVFDTLSKEEQNKLIASFEKDVTTLAIDNKELQKALSINRSDGDGIRYHNI
jgi:hypothetical protein